MTVGKRLLLTALLLGGFGFWAGSVFADTFIINGEKLLDGRVNTRGATDGDVMKYDAATMQWAAAADDTGAGGVATNDTASAVLIGTGSGWAQETDAKIDSSGNISGVVGTFTGSVFGAGNGFQITAGTELLRTPAHVGTDTQWRIRHRTDGALDGRLAFQLYDASALFQFQHQFLPTGEVIFGAGVTANGVVALKDDNYIYDNKYLAFGTGADIQLEYVTGTPDRLHLGDGTNAFLTVQDAGATGTFDLTGTLTASGLLTATTGLTIPDDQTLTMGDVTIVYDETTDDRLEITGAVDISGASTLGSTLDVTGLASLDGGIDVDGTLTVDGTTGVLTTSELVNLDGGFKVANDQLVVTAGGVLTSKVGITALGLGLGTTGNFGVTADGIMTADALANLDGGIKVNTDKFVVATDGDTEIDGTLDVGGSVTLSGGPGTTLTATSTVATFNSVSTNGNATFGDTSADTITCNGRLILRVLASSPDTLTQGSIGEIAFCSADSKVYVCTASSPYSWSALN